MAERGPLTGIRVTALTETVPGPLASLILADLGAEVTVVERPSGDPARGMPAVFEALGRNKRFVALDLRDQADRAIAEALLTEADVILTGYRPDVARRLGLAPADIRERHPAAVVVSITASGDDQGAPILPAHDLSAQAAAGLLRTDEPMSEGSFDGPPVADLAAGMYAAIAALSGLVARGRGWESVGYGVSMVDAALALNAFALTRTLRGMAPEDGLQAPAGYATYRCGDGSIVAVGVSYEAPLWATLCRELGLVDLAGLSVDVRVRRRDELRVRLEEAFSGCVAEQVVRRLRAAGVPVDMALDADAVVGSSAFRASVVEDPSSTGHLASPIVVDGHRLPVRHAAPREPGADLPEVMGRLGKEPVVSD